MTPPDDDEPPPDPATEPEPILEPEPVACWRCGLAVAAKRAECPHCRARLRTPAPPVKPAPPADDGRPLFVALRGFFALLVVSIVHGAVLAGADDNQPQAVENVTLAVFEAIDTVIILITWAACGSARLPPPPPPPGRRPLAWAAAWPLLAVMLLVNVGYHAVLREYAKFDGLNLPAPPGVTLVTVLLICVQPAVVEELFFRYLLLGVLRRHAGVHGAVLASAAAFALCHVHALLSMPYLFLVGAFLGYARVASRSMFLPVALHFTHNLAVLALEGIL
jgi:membrane protease YdiL (CAAX protease family)